MTRKELESFNVGDTVYERHTFVRKVTVAPRGRRDKQATYKVLASRVERLSEPDVFAAVGDLRN